MSTKIDFDKLFKDKKVILAPMAGITSFAYRQFMSKFGTAMEYSEMISDCGLIYKNKETKDLLFTDNKENFLVIQLFGGDKDNLVKAVKILESYNINYKMIDINLGCPVYKVVRNNGGSAWLKDLSSLEDCMQEIVKTSSKPVSVKIRLGWDQEHINVREAVKMFEKVGVSLIAIHARTTKQGYSGTAQYNELNNIQDLVKIPIVISGDIFTASDAKKALEITKAKAVMVARGAIGNPKLILEINNLLVDGTMVNEIRSFDEQKKFLIEFMDMLIEEKGEELAVRLLRSIAPKFFSSFPNSKVLRVSLSNNIFKREDVLNILNSYCNE